MIDRGIIKWKPFDSCYSSNKIIIDVNKEKLKKSIPILSEDQKEIIEEKLITAFYLKINIKLEYYYGGIIKYEYGIIKNINKIEKKIYLNNKFIYFKQILNINY